MPVQQLKDRLQLAWEGNLARKLQLPVGVDLSSNDYLGFASDAKLYKRILERAATMTQLGATGSRLLRGNLAIHEETEALLAAFVARETALFFPSGYQANLALLSALLRSNDVVFSDALNHASIVDGIRLTKAEKIIFPHRDYQFLEEQLLAATHCQGLKVIVTESLFSMEGTLADLRKLAELAARFRALLVVDEAHSTGLWGPSLVATLGLQEHVFATIHTAGKALGTSGAWVAGNALLKDYLINLARPFIFSTAPVPFLALALQEAVHFYQEVGQERAATVLNRAQMLWGLLERAGDSQTSSLLCQKDETAPAIGWHIPVPHGLSGREEKKFDFMSRKIPIIPILVGDNALAIELSQALQQRNWDVRAIRPPTVPKGTARLRVTVKWTNSVDQLTQFATDLTELFNQLAGNRAVSGFNAPALSAAGDSKNPLPPAFFAVGEGKGGG